MTGLPRLALSAALVVATSAPFECSIAQSPARVARIGYLTPLAQPEREAALRQELRRLGYVEGKNLVIEYRSAEGRFDRLPGLAEELVALRADVIVAALTQAAIAAKNATGSIPVVMVGVADPVGSALVTSLARPGGNVTGTSAVAADVVGKQIELLRELLPRASRVSVLWNPANPVFQQRQMHELTAAAAKVQLQVHRVELIAADGLGRAFAQIARERTDALFVLGDPLFTDQFARIAALAIQHRLPTVGGATQNAEDGALLVYGPDYIDAYRRAAGYVQRILKGDKAGELAVEQSAKFELIVNARTARAIGVAIPPALLVRADRVVR